MCIQAQVPQWHPLLLVLRCQVPSDGKNNLRCLIDRGNGSPLRASTRTPIAIGPFDKLLDAVDRCRARSRRGSGPDPTRMWSIYTPPLRCEKVAWCYLLIDPRSFDSLFVLAKRSLGSCTLADVYIALDTAARLPCDKNLVWLHTLWGSKSKVPRPLVLALRRWVRLRFAHRARTGHILLGNIGACI